MNLFRKQFYGLLTILLFAGTVFVLNRQGGTVYAADTADYRVEQHTDISAYRQEGDFKAPVFAGDGSEKWIFAGWYTDQACTRALSESVVSPVKEGNYYAKYVRREVLSVKCQLKEGTDADSAYTILRFVSSVDSLKYKSIGMELVTPRGSVKRMQSKEVGTRIQARSDVDLGEYTYSPKAVDAESAYFFSATEKINQADFAKGYMAKPYWITEDGTCVYGVSKYVTVNEGIQRDVLYIPVKMAVPAENAVFTVDGKTAAYKAYDANGGYAHLEVQGGSTEAATKYQILDASGQEVGTYIYHNMAVKYDGANSDTSWYQVYKEDGRSRFTIATSAELYGFATLVNENENFAGKEVYLVSDVEINTGNAADWEAQAPAYSWMPIGLSDSKAFEGTFDGQGHTISGVYLKTAQAYSGFFGIVGANAETKSKVRNFSLLNSYLETSAASFGSIAGRLRGTVDTIYSDAIVVSDGINVGGLIGQIPANSRVTLNNCWFAGTVTNRANEVSKRGVGGLVGTNLSTSSETELTNCLFTGTVDASVYCAPTSETNRTVAPIAGGLVGSVGYQSTMRISYSLSAGSILVHETATAAYGQVLGYVNDGSKVTQTCVYASNGCSKVNIGKDAGSSIDCTLSKMLGENAKKEVRGLFNGSNLWVIVENGIPVLKSFLQYGKDAGETSFLHEWLRTTSPLKVTLGTPQEVHSASGNVRQQGGYTDGHYFYQAVITETVSPETNNKVVIVKTDLTGKEESLVSKELLLGHGNDITYNEKTGELIVCTMKPNGELAFFDPVSLELKRTQLPEVYINNIAYNAKRDCYVVGYQTKEESDGTYRQFGIMDSNFKGIKGPFKPNEDTWSLVGQGVACDDEYIYMILSENKAISKNPVIAVYDWEGQFVKMIYLTLPSNADARIEAENISVVDNTIYIGVTEWWKSPATRKAMVYSFTR